MRKKKKEKLIKIVWTILSAIIIFSMIAWTMSFTFF
jgi:hypothetical protein